MLAGNASMHNKICNFRQHFRTWISNAQNFLNPAVHWKGVLVLGFFYSSTEIKYLRSLAVHSVAKLSAKFHSEKNFWYPKPFRFFHSASSIWPCILLFSKQVSCFLYSCYSWSSPLRGSWFYCKTSIRVWISLHLSNKPSVARSKHALMQTISSLCSQPFNVHSW